MESSNYSRNSFQNSYNEELENASLVLLDIARFLTVYVQPLFCVLGIAGNGLSLLIFLSKDLRKVSSNIYLSVLSAACTVFLISLLVVWLEVIHVKVIHENIWCQSIVFVTYVSSFLTVWSVVCITVENYIVTFHLRKATYFCTVPKAKLVVLFLTVIGILLYTFSLWSVKVVNYMGMNICTSDPEYQETTKIFTFVDTIVTLVLPTGALLVLISAILAKHLWQRHRKKNEEEQSGRKRLSKKEKSLLKITRVLLAIGLTYVVLGGPSYINKLRSMFINTSEVSVSLNERSMNQIFQIIFYLTFCFNFAFYSMWSLNFRRGLKRLCCCKCKINTKFDQDLQGLTLTRAGQTSNVTERTVGQHFTITSLK